MGKSSTSFKKGHSGNPNGRPVTKIDPVKWEEIRVDKQTMKDCIRVYLKLTPKQTEERIAQDDCTNAECIVAELVTRAKGDHNTAKILLEFAFGDMAQGPELIELSLVEQEMVNEYRKRVSESAQDAG